MADEVPDPTDEPRHEAKPPRKRPRDDDEDAEDRPRRRPRELDDDDEDDDRPRRRRRRRDDDDYEDEGDQGLQYVVPVNTSALAIIAGYVGLISVLCIPAPFALILGIVALVQLKKKPKLHGKGRAIFAIVMGTIFTILPIVLLLFGALAK
jgi:hypothetical protein